MIRTAMACAWSLVAAAVTAPLAGPPLAHRLRPDPARPAQALQAAQAPGGAVPGATGLHAAWDQLLEMYVRDGLVYYRALRADRARLDRYVASLGEVPAGWDAWDRDRRLAFWLNAYNALVVRTIVDNYPIQGRTPGSPANSILQIPGAFGGRAWRVAGDKVTLDDIERRHLAAFKDPRAFFGIGRGSVGGGRLRSEAFEPARLAAQLADVVSDCVRRVSCADVAEATGTLEVSPIFSWREAEFTAAYGERARDRFPGRSPIELAIVDFIEPVLYASERSWLGGNAFAVRFRDYDWRLNDLTGGGPQ
jgi:hypothetical protein